MLMDDAAVAITLLQEGEGTTLLPGRPMGDKGHRKHGKDAPLPDAGVAEGKQEGGQAGGCLDLDVPQDPHPPPGRPIPPAWHR